MSKAPSPKDLVLETSPTSSSSANVDMERTFSVYKTVLTDRSHCLTEENVVKIMVTHCFYSGAVSILVLLLFWCCFYSGAVSILVLLLFSCCFYSGAASILVLLTASYSIP